VVFDITAEINRIKKSVDVPFSGERISEDVDPSKIAGYALA
tara:strand:+ start:890 stop:1012 length:123 start_codon:yes stop_codon:yes gene_type:complete